MPNYIIVYITSSTKEEAIKIGQGVIEKKLAACAQISQPILSIYTWKGKICNDEEYLITLKTKTSLFDKLKNYVTENHSYEIPQIVAIPIETGSAEYLKWIDDSVSD